MPAFDPATVSSVDHDVRQNSWLLASSQIDLDNVKNALIRNRWIVTAICIIALLLGVTVTFLTVPNYRAESTLQIDQQASRVMDAPDIEPTQSFQDADRFLQTQMEILRSRALATRVAEGLGLFNNTGFLAMMRIEPIQIDGKPEIAEQKRQEQVISVLRDNLSVSLPEGSRIARLAFDSPDPVLAARIANAFADAMISSNLNRRFDTSSYARQFLSQQLERAKERLEASEQSMVAYARSAGLIDTDAVRQGGSGSNAPSLTATSLIQANDALSTARSRRIDAEQLWLSAQQSRLMSLPEVLSNPAVQTMLERRAELDAEYAQQKSRRQNDHPDMIRLQNEMGSVDQRIKQLAEDIRASIRNRYTTAKLQEDQMQLQVDALKGATLTEQNRSIRYTILRREVQTNRELYDGLLQRFKEVSAAAGVSANNISIVDMATVPSRPVSPNLPVNTGLALLAGLVVSLGFVYLRENLNDSVRSLEDAERKLGIIGLGMIPMVEAGLDFRQAVNTNGSAISEAFHTIRSTFELSNTGEVPRTLLITSCSKREGKTSISYGLARDFANIGRRVLLVDADMRRPSMHKLLNQKNIAGLSSLLSGDKQLSEVLRSTEINGLDFISAGDVVANPAELLASPTLFSLIVTLEDLYDIVIFDGPPMLGLADAPMIAAHIEATLLVADASRAEAKALRVALRRLRLNRARLCGVVVNRVEVRTLGYGYEYYYQYDDKVDQQSRPWWRRK